MPMLLHPWFNEAALVARRRHGVTALLASAAVLLALAALAVSAPSSAQVLGAWALRLCLSWPVAMTLVIAALSYAGNRRRVLALARSLQTGWWVAMPIAAQVTSRSLRLVSLALAALHVLAAVALLLAAATLAHLHGAPVPPGLAGVVATAMAAALAGSVLGSASALRQPHAAQRQRARDGVRQPLWSLRWLHDHRLPYLLDWQRREALLQWRRGGNFWVLGAVMVFLPVGVSPAVVAASLMLAMAIAWLGVVARSAIATTLGARRLLRAQPVATLTFSRAALRYPALAFVGVLLTVGGASAALSRSATATSAWLAVTLVLPLLLAAPSVITLAVARRRAS